MPDNVTLKYLNLTGGNGLGGTLIFGGAINSLFSNLTLDNCNLSGNTSPDYGGAIRSIGGNTTLRSCELSGNSAPLNGGAIVQSAGGPAGGTLTIDTCIFSGNSATYGGSVYSLVDTTVTNSHFNGNLATDQGGGIFIDPAVLTIINCTFSGNSAPAGADLYSLNSTVNIVSSSIANVASSGGTVTVFADVASYGTSVINDLIAQVATLNLTDAQRHSLTVKLQAAQQSLANGNATAAANQLNAFDNQVNALVNSHRLGQITAEDLIAEVQSLIDEIT
jgi:hypothetical protein